MSFFHQFHQILYFLMFHCFYYLYNFASFNKKKWLTQKFWREFNYYLLTKQFLSDKMEKYKMLLITIYIQFNNFKQFLQNLPKTQIQYKQPTQAKIVLKKRCTLSRLPPSPCTLSRSPDLIVYTVAHIKWKENAVTRLSQLDFLKNRC